MPPPQSGTTEHGACTASPATRTCGMRRSSDMLWRSGLLRATLPRTTRTAASEVRLTLNFLFGRLLTMTARQPPSAGESACRSGSSRRRFRRPRLPQPSPVRLASRSKLLKSSPVYTQCEESGTWATGAQLFAAPPPRPWQTHSFFVPNSCYMSVILQTFLCNPYLRSYFLSDRHNRLACAKTLQGEPCLSCELNLLFSEVSIVASSPLALGRQG